METTAIGVPIADVPVPRDNRRDDAAGAYQRRVKLLVDILKQVVKA